MVNVIDEFIGLQLTTYHTRENYAVHVGKRSKTTFGPRQPSHRVELLIFCSPGPENTPIELCQICINFIDLRYRSLS